MTRAWTVRGGRSGEWEHIALSEGLSILGWERLGDLSGCSSADDIGEMLSEAYPWESDGTIDSWKRQLWRFISMDIGDYVVMPRKQQPVVAIGELTGPYEFQADEPRGFRHVRRVDWKCPSVPRSTIRADLRDSMGAFLTVSELTRRDAVARVQELIKTGSDPGYAGAIDPPESPEGLSSDVQEGGSRQLTARDLIGLWGAERRTPDAIDLVNHELAVRRLCVKPHFTDGQLDSLVTVSSLEASDREAPEQSGRTEDPDDPHKHKRADRDLTWRIGNLPFVRDVVTVEMNAPLSHAFAPMIERDFSQIPVVDHNHVLRGVITWEGIARAQLGGGATSVSSVMDPHPETAREQEELFGRIDRIQKSGFTIVVDDENTVIGMMTSADLAGQLKERIEPFTLLEEVERRLRRLTKDFPAERVPAKIRKGRASGRPFTLGQYVHLLEDADCWAELGWPFDQQQILERLRTVTKYRNELAHWAVDAPSEDATALATTAGLLELLKIVDRDPST
ncbi:CBS domain-containing protein [Streptomyces sp. NPDC058374]|uniref:CBS domain-containing protein n=1 Tax=Streptomyces sp. NPDC058374 TaxID=3346466 RepID=UPI00364A3C35